MRIPSSISITLASAFALTAASFNALHGCDSPSATTTDASPRSGASSNQDADASILVTVNGVPIVVHDLHYLLAQEDKGRGKGVDDKRAKEALEKIIDEELARQRAVALGLADNAEYQRKLGFMEAPVNDFKRSELTKLHFKEEVTDKSAVDEAEARGEFDANRDHYQTEVHVSQILVRNNDEKIKRLKSELDAGKKFDDVAATLFQANLPGNTRAPWDLGFLRWYQMPPVWSDALQGMKAGDVSEILHGPNGRAWIIKLVERKNDDALRFEEIKPELIKTLRAAKAAKLRAQIAQQLRSDAKIVYVQEPGAMPPPPDTDE